MLFKSTQQLSKINQNATFAKVKNYSNLTLGEKMKIKIKTYNNLSVYTLLYNWGCDCAQEEPFTFNSNHHIDIFIN